jgi:hypothetical protein
MKQVQQQPQQQQSQQQQLPPLLSLDNANTDSDTQTLPSSQPTVTTTTIASTSTSSTTSTMTTTTMTDGEQRVTSAQSAVRRWRADVDALFRRSAGVSGEAGKMRECWNRASFVALELERRVGVKCCWNFQLLENVLECE